MEARAIPHTYFDTVVHEKDGRYIGTPSQEFWDSWRSARYPKRGPNKGNIGEFRESWGMFKADPKDMDEILDMAGHGSSVSFVNSTQKDDYEDRGAVWFIVNLKPIEMTCKKNMNKGVING
jgi:hypothetical protein